MNPTLASAVINRLRERVGREGDAAADMPAGLAVNLLRDKGMALARGLIRTRKLVFLERRVRLRGKRSVTFGRGSSVGTGSFIDGYATHGVSLGHASRLGSYCVVTCTSHVSRIGRGFTLGNNSGLGDFCHVGASGGVTIGNDVIIGPFVSFHSQEHIYQRTDVPIRFQGTSEKGIRVGDGCWFGSRVTVLDGTDIGGGSIIAAGAVVKGGFPPRSIIAGVPGRVVRSLDEPSAAEQSGQVRQE